MNTYIRLLDDVQKLGILPTDVITIHSSMKKIGETEGGADTVLDVFCDYLGKDGLVSFPSHTWGDVVDGKYTYYPDTSRSTLGLLPELFRKRKGVVRSLHPTHSVCAYGKNAASFVETPLPQSSLCPRNGCYGKLYDWGGKVLLMGVTLASCTFFHAIEEWEDGQTPPSFYQPWADCKIVLPTGEVVDNPVYLESGDSSLLFDKAMTAVLAEPSTKTGKIGNADCILLDCRKTYPIIAKLMKEQPDFFWKP
ncbi:MAG: AAC(3) family N-acetyltransferase [Ruminococcaceae bacterium]|nr:AAC(3) family N-acetyltransferase [Oscillospiraceae bacterium]